MLCQNCNSEIPDEAKFCPKCGVNLKDSIQRVGSYIIAPEINVSPVISVGGEDARVKIDTYKLEERIKIPKNEIKRFLAIKSEDLRKLEREYTKEDMIRIFESNRILIQMVRMSDHKVKTEDYLDKLGLLKGYTERFSDNFTRHVDEFSRFMEEEQGPYLDDEYKGKVRRFCTNLVDVWINEFLKG